MVFVRLEKLGGAWGEANCRRESQLFWEVVCDQTSIGEVVADVKASFGVAVGPRRESRQRDCPSRPPYETERLSGCEKPELSQGIDNYGCKIHRIIVYWPLTRNTNIWECVGGNTLDIFPYQSCLSREKSVSVVLVTWEIHISRVGHASVYWL